MLGVVEASSMILAVARQEHQKGLDVLLEALPAVTASIPGAVLVVAGRDGGSTPDLRAAVERLGLGDRVTFLGARDDVAELLCAADVLAMPSRWEGFGGTLLEAMALEATIVASDLAPVREIVEDDVSATLVPPEDPVSLAHALIATLKDPERARGLARQARERFLAAFTVDAVADAMRAFYGRAVGARAS
jgi:glycosyltransferase involved in cell wall biosynthesis